MNLASRVFSRRIVFACLLMLISTTSQSGILVTVEGMSSQPASNAKILIGSSLIIGSLAAAAGAITVIALIGAGTLGVGFYGLGIPLLFIASPLLLVFDATKRPLFEELKFVDPQTKVAIEDLIQKALAQRKDPTKTIVLDPILVEKLLREESASEYSEEQIKTAIRVLCT